MSKFQVIKKLIMKDCGCTFEIDKPKKKPKHDCKSCGSSGELEDSIYFHIGNGIAFDGDTIK